MRVRDKPSTNTKQGEGLNLQMGGVPKNHKHYNQVLEYHKKTNHLKLSITLAE